MRHLRIISDGTANDTVITDEDGKRIDGVVGVSFRCDVDSDFSEAAMTLDLTAVTTDVHGKLVECKFVCPGCLHEHRCTPS
jgi:hypothetical protein